MSPVKPADEHESRHRRHDQPETSVAIPGMAVGVDLKLQMTGPEETGSHATAPAATPPVIATAPHQEDQPPPETMAPGPSQFPATPSTFQRPVSRENLSTDRPFAPFTQGENVEGEDNIPQSSPQQHTQPSNLLKRRASVSPEKFNTGRFEPLAIRTDLPIPSHSHPAKRSRTENKIEIQYDANGTPRIKETLESIRAGFSPVATCSTGLSPPLSALNSTQHILATRLLTGRKTRSPPPQQHEQKFNIFQALINNRALCSHFVSCLTIPSLIDLYAISKTFHHTFNRHATAFILSSMREWAPMADQIFPWRCYKPLCVKDPVKKQKSMPTSLGADIEKLGELSRDVPSIRWLQMVVWREGIVKDMLIQLATKALLTPSGTRNAIKRMWFILDLPLNAHRLALIRSPTYITNRTIHLAVHFFLKVDMAFTDPGYDVFPTNHPNQDQFPNHWGHGAAVGCNLREKLIAERTFTPLWRVLRGWSWDPEDDIRPMETIDVLRLWTRHRAVIPDVALEDVGDETAMGYLVGPVPLAGYERVYDPAQDTRLTEEERQHAIAVMPGNPYRPRPLLRPDELLMGEGVRRQLSQHLWWMEMMLWGFVSPDGRNIRVKSEEEILGIGRKGSARPQGSAEAKVPQQLESTPVVDKGQGKGKGKAMEDEDNNADSTDQLLKTLDTAMFSPGSAKI